MDIQQVIEKLNKHYGENTVMRLCDAPDSAFSLSVIPSGIPELDYAVGVGGFPRGRTVELYGNPGSGKSTIALYTIAAAQKLGCSAAYLDVEQTFSRSLAKAYGVQEESLFIAQPSTGEQAIDIAEGLLRSGVDIVVIDSVSSLIPASEATGTMEENYIGLHARLMSKALRKLTPAMNTNKERRGLVIFINQFREKVGVMFGDPRITTGGNALKYYASLRIEVHSGAKEDRILAKDAQGKEEQIGQVIHMRVTKNKVAAPYKEAAARLIYGVGIDMVDQMIRVGCAVGLIVQKGSFYTVKGLDEPVRGRDVLYDVISGNKALQEQLRQEIEDIIRTGKSCKADDKIG